MCVCVRVRYRGGNWTRSAFSSARTNPTANSKWTRDLCVSYILYAGKTTCPNIKTSFHALVYSRSSPNDKIKTICSINVPVAIECLLLSFVNQGEFSLRDRVSFTSRKAYKYIIFVFAVCIICIRNICTNNILFTSYSSVVALVPLTSFLKVE